jgi:hypothetical protein
MALPWGALGVGSAAAGPGDNSHGNGEDNVLCPGNAIRATAGPAEAKRDAQASPSPATNSEQAALDWLAAQGCLSHSRAGPAAQPQTQPGGASAPVEAMVGARAGVKAPLVILGADLVHATSQVGGRRLCSPARVTRAAVKLACGIK